MFLYIPDMDFVLKKKSKKHKIYILSFKFFFSNLLSFIFSHCIENLYRLFLSLYSALEPTNAPKH